MIKVLIITLSQDLSETLLLPEYQTNQSLERASEVGDDKIRRVFTDHFRSLYQPNTLGADSCYADSINKLLTMQFSRSTYSIHRHRNN